MVGKLAQPTATMNGILLCIITYASSTFQDIVGEFI